MTPSDFPQSNITLTPPEDMDESQVQRIQAFHGDATQGNLDGAHIVITCWKPTVNVGFPY